MGLSPARAQVVQVLQSGGDRLTQLQDVSGAWSFYANSPGAAANIVGPIGIGLARALTVTNDPNHTAALSQAATYFQSQTNFHTWDGILAQSLDQALGGTANVDHVRTNFYDQLNAGTYTHTVGGATFSNLDTIDYINVLFAFRGSQGLTNLSAWDLGFGIASARAVVPGQEQDWIDGTHAAVNNLQTGTYDVLGLAGAIFGMATANDTSFNPTSGLAAGANNLNEMGDLLAGFQVSGSGGMRYRSDLADLPGNETIQETAYTIFALDALDRAGYLDNINQAAQFLYGSQMGTGGWRNSPTGAENNEVTGEALWGLVVAPVPEPSTWVMLVLAASAGALAVRRRRLQRVGPPLPPSPA